MRVCVCVRVQTWSASCPLPSFILLMTTLPLPPVYLHLSGSHSGISTPETCTQNKTRLKCHFLFTLQLPEIQRTQNSPNSGNSYILHTYIVTVQVGEWFRNPKLSTSSWICFMEEQTITWLTTVQERSLCLDVERASTQPMHKKKRLVTRANQQYSTITIKGSSPQTINSRGRKETVVDAWRCQVWGYEWSK